jgi:hypothetical protein
VALDLETVCLKCLQKDPRQRHASASDLANDLRHFLAGEPMQVRPTVIWRRGRSWAKRHPAAALAALLLLLITAAGLPGVIRLWRPAGAAYQEAERRAGELETALYFERIPLAEREESAHHVGRAGQLLAKCLASFRGWEWYHFQQRRCRADRHATLGHQGWSLTADHREFSRPSPVHSRASDAGSDDWNERPSSSTSASDPGRGRRMLRTIVPEADEPALFPCQHQGLRP